MHYSESILEMLLSQKYKNKIVQVKMIKFWSLNYTLVSDWLSKGAHADTFPAPEVQTQVPKLM